MATLNIIVSFSVLTKPFKIYYKYFTILFESNIILIFKMIHLPIPWPWVWILILLCNGVIKGQEEESTHATFVDKDALMPVSTNFDSR